jgi:TfoX/Sxy family transcriptional regulator of competence genes
MSAISKKQAMAYNEKLSDRVREIISLTHEDVEEKKMFSGMCFMVNDKMCVGVQKDRLMVRLDPLNIDEALEKEGCIPMEMKGKVLKSFVWVLEDAVATKKQLSYWVNLALDFNPLAKSSKKRK